MFHDFHHDGGDGDDDDDDVDDDDGDGDGDDDHDHDDMIMTMENAYKSSCTFACLGKAWALRVNK